MPGFFEIKSCRTISTTGLFEIEYCQTKNMTGFIIKTRFFFLISSLPMEFLKDPLNNPQVNISYKNNKLVRPIKPRNLYPSPFTGIFKQSNVDLYQNPLLKRQSHVAPSFYIQNGSSFGQSFFGPNYFENIVGNKVSDVEINYQQEKKKINDEKESTDVNYKKKSNNKRKFGNEGESNNNWQVYEVDILLQYIADNFD
ncbi:hypothetical protein RhiirB3_474921, partial [Rhizophagus irregularis]